MVDMYKSVEIYNHLMNGRIINRERLGSHGEFESEALFSEIMDNLGDYKNQYAMSNASQLRQKLNKSNKIAHLISRWAILL